MVTLTQSRKRQRAQLSAGYANHSKSLLRYAKSKIHDTDIPQDLVQNTFLKTWTYLVKGGKVDMMEAFLFHILRALIIDEYRKRKTTSLDALMEKGFEPWFDNHNRTLDIYDGKQAVELIGKLPLQYQKVMRLRYVQDLSLKEIALITGKKKNTVAVQLHRGLKKLKVLYRARTV